MINRIRSSIFIRYSDNFSNIINLSENKYLQIPNHLTYIYIYTRLGIEGKGEENDLFESLPPPVCTRV